MAGIVIVLLGPITALLCSGIAGLRNSSLAAFVRGVRCAGRAGGCMLLLVYAVLVIGTLPAEAAVRSSIDQQTVHEGRYLSRLVGRTWPQ